MDVFRKCDQIRNFSIGYENYKKRKTLPDCACDRF